ncbi:hypothetical protein [Streptomyces sp. NPDC059398]|uniref:hypothetical protein n=1 Tax=Streptomyces sp. NPDC059398 TaxID=3346820 RepID=UPI00367D11FD
MDTGTDRTDEPGPGPSPRTATPGAGVTTAAVATPRLTPHGGRPVSAAARNNAEWCDALCRTHGVRGVFSPAAWTCAERTPPYYPDAVTLAPGADAAALLAAVDTAAPGCTVKDSFADLDLTGHGFDVLFDAEWIHRPATLPAPPAPEGVRWERVRTAEGLEEWERAWDGGVRGLFLPALLADRHTAVLAARRGGQWVAGAVVSASATATGVSNLFTVGEYSPDAAWDGCLAAIAARRPGLPVAGYESGDDLNTALRHGFEPAGPLRVWLREG